MAYEEWMDKAKCADMTVDPDIYFSTDPVDITTAKALRRECTVKTDCAMYALANREREGLWSGMEMMELRQTARKVGIPTPRSRRIT